MYTELETRVHTCSLRTDRDGSIQATGKDLRLSTTHALTTHDYFSPTLNRAFHRPSEYQIANTGTVSVSDAC